MSEQPNTATETKPARRWQHLSEQQRTFLRTLHGKPATLGELQKQLKIPSPMLHRWLRSKKFRVALAVVMRELRRRRDLAIEVCSLRACEKISQMVSSRKTNVARLASMDMMRLTQKVALGKRSVTRRRRAANAPPALADAPPPATTAKLPNDLSAEDAERLLDELETARADVSK